LRRFDLEFLAQAPHVNAQVVGVLRQLFGVLGEPRINVLDLNLALDTPR
jgi:K+-transporting ATPase c subunit